jgi:predicted nucleic acid-binding protein
LNCFNYVSIDDSVWNALGILLNKLKKNGITLPFQDALMAVLAIKKGLSIWSKDQHFLLIQNVVPELQIFKKY